MNQISATIILVASMALSALAEDINQEIIKPINGKLYFGYEDDFSWQYAFMMKKNTQNNTYDVSWHLPDHDKEWRKLCPFRLIKNNGKELQFLRGSPAEWIYEAEIDAKGNLVNGKRYKLKNGVKDANDAMWGLLLVK
jgi:hypothetical protein